MHPAIERRLGHVTSSLIGCVHAQNDPSNHNEAEQSSCHLFNSLKGLFRRPERVRDYITQPSYKLFQYHISCLRRLVHNIKVDKPLICNAQQQWFSVALVNAFLHIYECVILFKMYLSICHSHLIWTFSMFSHLSYISCCTFLRIERRSV